MLNILISIIGIAITVTLVVGVHEFGHFIIARLCGVKIHCFSIGFGKALLKWKDKQGTEFKIAAIPLGGYVKMLDENEENVDPSELHKSFNRQPFYKKFAIIAAGPAFNMIFAIVVYTLLFIIGFNTIKPIIGAITPHSIAANAKLKPQEEIIKIDNQITPSWAKVLFNIMLRSGDKGYLQIETHALTNQQIKNYKLDLTNWKMNNLKPDPFTSLGLTPYSPVIPAIIHSTLPGSPATKANLKTNDQIVAIDKKPIHDWTEIPLIVSTSPGKKLNFEIIRANKKIIVPITIGSKKSWWHKERGFIGISPFIPEHPELIKHVQYAPVTALIYAVKETGSLIHLNFILFGKLLTGQVSLQSLGGPLTIFESAGSAINLGFVPFLSFLAFLSISIGFINIIPIPGLDGGHLLFQTIEFIIRRPVSLKTQELFYRLGFILLILLIIQSLANDIMRL